MRNIAKIRTFPNPDDAPAPGARDPEGASALGAGDSEAGRAPGARDPEAVQRFIERYATELTEAGIPRMPARVFVALLTTEDGCLTAAELAALLQASPGTISGAVRYLILVNVVTRERRSGDRRDRYRIRDDAWYEAALHRDRLFTRWKASMQEGVAVLGPETRAGERLAETIAFFDFVGEEVPELLERWRVRRAELRAARGANP